MTASIDVRYPLDTGPAGIDRTAHGRCGRALKSRKTGTPAGVRILDPPRSVASLGGNVARHTGSCLPALLALDATLEILAPAGPRHVALMDWLGKPAAPGSFIFAMTVTAQLEGSPTTLHRVGLRAAFSPSVVSSARWLSLTEA